MKLQKLVECVPNFSEGRDRAKVAEITAAIRSVRGAWVLDVHSDPDHNRSVVTFAGAPEAVFEAALAATERAVELIDLNDHDGEHPRIGALDVLPFVPLKDITMDECVALAHAAGRRIASEFDIPVYFYERAALRAERRDLADIRRGEFEALREEIESEPDRTPDAGEARVHATAGAIAVGARPILIAYNVNLASDDIDAARAIARAVRGRDGGLRYVKALGMRLRNRAQVQVSMNLVNYQATPIHAAFEMVRSEAEARGIAISGSEIVGLVPQDALSRAAERYLRIEKGVTNHLLELRLAAAIDESEKKDPAKVPDGPAVSFADRVAERTAAPGGGSVAAHACVLAAALGEMVSRLTLGNDRSSLEHEAREILTKLEDLRSEMESAVNEDAESYSRVVAATRLPHSTEAERLKRQMALEQATRGALAVPMRVAESAVTVLELLDELSEIARTRLLSDLAVGAQMGLAAVRGAASIAEANLLEIPDREFVENCRRQVAELVGRGEEIAEGIAELN